MMKKGSVLLIALLLSLPGCKKGAKQGDQSKKNKKMAQRGDLFSRVNMPLADDDLQDADDNIKGLMLDDLDDFVAFTDGQEGDSQGSYSWATQSKKKDHTAYFEFNKDNVPSDQVKDVERSASTIKKQLEQDRAAGKTVAVRVEGHADTYGSRAYNMTLSGARAKNVSDILVAQGLSREDIALVPCGKEMPIKKSGSIADQWVNRRAEVYVVEKQA